MQLRRCEMREAFPKPRRKIRVQLLEQLRFAQRWNRDTRKHHRQICTHYGTVPKRLAAAASRRHVSSVSISAGVLSVRIRAMRGNRKA
jgi:hypothetical protein